MHFGEKINEDYINYKVGGNKNKKMRRIDMARMKKKYVYILGKKDEILNTFDNAVVFDGNMKGNQVENNKQKGSGCLVLFFSTFNDQKPDHDFMWTNNQFYDLKHNKKYICTVKNSHYGSKGYYASFGMKENYAIVDKSSLAEYTVVKKKSFKEKKDVVLK